MIDYYTPPYYLFTYMYFLYLPNKLPFLWQLCTDYACHRKDSLLAKRHSTVSLLMDSWTIQFYWLYLFFQVLFGKKGEVLDELSHML